MGARRPLALLGLAVLLLAGCRSADPGGRAPQPTRPAWRPVTLPAPPGAPGRLLLRDATACAGRWFVVGGVADRAGGTRPAVWISADGLSWRSLSVAPASYYGRQDVLYAAACHDGRLAALGAKSGGAHGNPRVSAWAQSEGDLLTEASASGELSGGVPDGDVARLAGGPTGWLVVGGGEHGPRSWASGDGHRFRRQPPSAGEAGVAQAAVYDVLAVDGGWLAVGGVTLPGRLDPVGTAWRSTDGRLWRRVAVPTPDGGAELQRVAASSGGPVAVGRSAAGFGAWSTEGDRWSAAGRFGSAGSARLPAVRGFAVAGLDLWVATTEDSGCRLWWSADGGGAWREVALPVATTGDGRAALAAGAGRLLLAMDDGRSTGLWVTSLPVEGS